MSKSPESKKRNEARQQKAQVERIRAAITNSAAGTPYMIRADGIILLREIDRLTDELKVIAGRLNP